VEPGSPSRCGNRCPSWRRAARRNQSSLRTPSSPGRRAGSRPARQRSSAWRFPPVRAGNRRRCSKAISSR
jgi:hypothetical protein